MNKALIPIVLLFVGLALALGCGSDPPTGGGGPVDSLRVSITSPADGAVVHGPTPLQAQVTGSSGNARVKFILDAVQVSVDSVAPWEYVWDPTLLQNGSSHTFRAIVSDNSGNADTTAIRTYFANYAKLTMTVQSPIDGSAIQLGQAFAATVVGGAGGTVIDFKVDNAIVFSDSAAPYEYLWDPSALPSGSAHTVQLIASDTAAQTVVSTVRTVYARYLPLTARIVSPADSSVIGQEEDIVVAITGGAGIYDLMFYVDDYISYMSYHTSSRFSYSWNPTALPNGSSYVVYVDVADTSGQGVTTATRTYFAKWRLLGTSSQSPHPINVRKVFSRSTSTALEFRVEFDNLWVRADSVGGIDCALFLDADQNNSSGRTFVLDGNNLQVPINDIGAEYRLIVGGHGDSLWTYNSGNWTSGRGLQALTIARNSNFFECSVLLTDVGSPEVFDLVVANVRFESTSSWTYDWVPTSGHLSYLIDGRYIGPPVGL